METRLFGDETFEAVTVTDIGNREINQDRTDLFARHGVNALLLADGMGGHPRGEVAAQIYIDSARLMLRKYAQPDFIANSYISETMKLAHDMIQSYGLRQEPVIYPRTTAVIVTVHGDTMQWAHLGDSRTYLFRYGRAHVRTLDHSPVEVLRLQGDIEDADAQSIASGRSGITKCLGGKNDVSDITITTPIVLRENDILLLCSDGVWSQLKQAELESLMLDESRTLEERTQALVTLAVQSRERSDNATALAYRWKGPAASTQTAATEESGDSIDSVVEQLKNLIDRYGQS